MTCLCGHNTNPQGSEQSIRIELPKVSILSNHNGMRLWTDQTIHLEVCPKCGIVKLDPETLK